MNKNTRTPITPLYPKPECIVLVEIARNAVKSSQQHK